MTTRRFQVTHMVLHLACTKLLGQHFPKVGNNTPWGGWGWLLERSKGDSPVYSHKENKFPKGTRGFF